MKSKLNKRKKIIIACSLTLASIAVTSIGLSQISFATNSFDNHIKMLTNNDDVKLESSMNKSRTHGNQNKYIQDWQIGLRVGNYTPFWKSDCPKYPWKTKGGYKYFQAPKAENFKASNYHTNPGIAFAWYASGDSIKNYGIRSGAGPGQITFYTRELENYYYQSDYFKSQFLNQEQKDAFERTFFGDINMDRNSFVNFIQTLVDKKYNYGTTATPYFLEQIDSGSVLAHLIFADKTINHADGPNIPLKSIVFYPSDNNIVYNMIRDEPVNANNYNTVWIGNEWSQDPNGDGLNSPIVDYNGVTNSALMRAATIDSFSLVSHEIGIPKNYYRVTGNIKFRIYYEYDFKRDASGEFNYSISNLTNQGLNLEDYLIPSENYNQYKNDINNKNVNLAYTIDNEKIKQLIIDNHLSMMKNLSYKSQQNDGRNVDGSIVSTDMIMTLPDFKDGLTPNEVNIGNGQIFIDPNNSDETSITFPVEININPVLKRNVTIKFHSRRSTLRLKNNIITDPSNKNIATTAIDINEAKEIIKRNLDQIFDNTTLVNNNANVVSIEGYDNVSGLQTGVIKFSSIVLDHVFVHGNQTQKQFFPINATTSFEINGFQSTNQNDLATTIKNDVNVAQLMNNTTNINWNKILPQTLSNDNVDLTNKDTMINHLKTLLIENQIIKNPDWTNNPIENNEIEVNVNSYNNTTGSAILSVVLNNYYDDLGNWITTPSQPKFITINGLMSLNTTEAKLNIEIVDDINQTADNKKFASEISDEQINNVVNKKIVTDGINYFLNNPINFAVDSIESTNNPWLVNTKVQISQKPPIVNDTEGTIEVFLEYAPYQSYSNVVNQPATFSIKLTGYLNKSINANKLSTTIQNGELSGVNSIIPDSIIGNEENVKQAIINSGLIKNPNPNASILTANDIELINLQPISKDGILNCSVTIKNSKVWTEGVVNVSKTFNNVSFSGFKMQAPTSLINTPIDLGLNNVNLENVANVFDRIIKPQLEAKINAIVVNRYPNSIVDFAYNPTGVNLSNGTLIIDVKITNGIYDNNGNRQPNGSFNGSIITTGFIKSDKYSTSLNSNIKLTGFENQIASNVNINNQTTNQQIKEVIAANIINPIPGHIPTSENVLNININSTNNLTGSLNLTIELSSKICVVNGKPAEINQRFVVDVFGFRILKPTAIGNLNVDGIFNKNQNVNAFVNNEQTISEIRNALLSPANDGLKAEMFPNGLPTPNSIQIEITPNPLQGSCVVNVNIPGPYVDNSGNIINNNFISSFELNGFLSDVNTTTVVINPVINPSEVVDLSKIISSDIEKDTVAISEKVKIGIVYSQTSIFENLTTGKTLTVNDILVNYIKGSFNNIEGTAKFNITLKNGVGCINGIPQQELIISDVNIGGFKKLQITSINNLKVSLDNISPSDFVKNRANAENEIKLSIYEYLKINHNMFPNELPKLENINVIINNLNDYQGLISARVEIAGVDYIPEFIETTKSKVKNTKGEIVQWNNTNPNPYVLDNVTVSGFQKSNWVERHQLLIALIVVGGVLIITLIILLVLKATGKIWVNKDKENKIINE